MLKLMDLNEEKRRKSMQPMTVSSLSIILQKVLMKLEGRSLRREIERT